MGEEWQIAVQMLAQAPIVGIFVFFVLKNNEQWRKYLSERNGKLESFIQKNTEVLDKLREHIDKNIDVFDAHDKWEHKVWQEQLRQFRRINKQAKIVNVVKTDGQK